VTVDPSSLDRFRAALIALAGDDPALRFGLAVSGGPDSLALLLLAHAALPGRIAAATFDHGLRAESAAEAEQLAAICYDLGVPHAILTRDAADAGRGQAAARGWRYAALARWCAGRGLPWLLTAHHADDQAETLLMRLARGAGVGGLSGIRPVRPLAHAVTLGRPLLGFAKAELVAIVQAAGLQAVDDPSNRDPAYDRTHARALLATADWLDPARIAAAADNLRAADGALAWAASCAWAERATIDAQGAAFSPEGLPEEIRRRLVETALRLVAPLPDPGHDGPELTRFIATLGDGGKGTLAGVVGQGGPVWRFTPAPPRRDASAAATGKKG
jgi:tRNA(Ile)-lysidine synthase